MVNIIDKVILPRTRSLHELCTQDARISIYTRILQRSGFASIFSSNTFQLTLFAPTNQAFSNWFAKTGLAFKNTTNECRVIVRKHAAFGAFFSNVMSTENVYGISTFYPRKKLLLRKLDTKEGFRFTNFPAASVERDIVATNGILHIIDNVLK